MTVTVEPTSATIAPSVQAKSAMLFAAGLVGCEDWKRFVLITDAGTELPLARLQSLDDSRIALIVTDPNRVAANYSVTLTSQDRADLDLADGVEAEVYCTLTVGSDGWLTANLLGPLVVNPVNLHGKQLVLTESGYSPAHPIKQLLEAE
jgi:flagellar assembly factor FliW